MRHLRRRRRGAALLVVVAVVALAGCSADPDILSPGERSGGDALPPADDTTSTGTPGAVPVAEPTPTAAPPTPTPLPLPVRVRVAPEIRVVVGGSAVVDIGLDVAPGAGPVTVDIEGAPDGVGVGSSWRPTRPGTWAATVTVTDGLGRVSEHALDFVARHPASPDALVAIGDSVASGHGLQITDYLGGDPCFRSDDGYPHVAADLLAARGVLPDDASVAVVACSGADTAALTDDPVPGGRAEWSPDGRELSQVEWVLRANPAVVTVTVGINDIGFVDPARLVIDGRLDRGSFDRRVDAMRRRLADALATIVEGTDATVVVTGYHDPTATVPQGVDGCADACFAAVTAEAIAALDDAIVAALPDDPRVRFVGLVDLFAGHGAPNGLGPDGARAGDGLLGQLIGDTFEGIHPYCARGDDDGTSWVNAVDCVHPDAAGHAAIAAAVADAVAAPAARPEAGQG